MKKNRVTLKGLKQTKRIKPAVRVVMKYGKRKITGPRAEVRKIK